MVKMQKMNMKWSVGKLASLIALSVMHAGADTYSTSPADAWSQQGGALVFDSSSSGTLGSTTSTQSTSTSAGLSGAVSLEKKGSGTLTVNGVHSFTGDVLIREGTLAVGDGTHDKTNPRNSALGDPLTAKKVVVYTNATLSITQNNIFGNAKTSTADILADVEVRGGTLTIANGRCNEFGNVLFYDATANLGGINARWPGFMVSGDWLEFGSSTATPFTLVSTYGVRFGKRKPVEIRVPDITGDTASDVIFPYVNDEPLRDVKWDSPISFVKTGAGTLEFASEDSTFLRDVVISNGTLKLTAGNARIGNAASSLGSTVIPHTIYIESGATLNLAKSDHFGQFYNNQTGVCIHVRGGTLKQDAGRSNAFGPLVLEDATLLYGAGSRDSGGRLWPTFRFSDVTFKGKSAYSFPSVADACFVFGSTNGMCDLRVEKIVSGGVYSGAPDVTISTAVKDCTHIYGVNGYGPQATTFRKTGTGVLKLDNVGNSFTGDVEIAEGVVTLKKYGTNYGFDPTNGPLGNLMANRTVTVCGSGELYYAENDQLGQACANYGFSMVVSNGTVRFKSGTINALPTVKFYDANLIYGNGYGSNANGETANWGLWIFRYPVTFDGTKVLSLPSNGDKCIMSLGYSSDFSEEVSGSLTNCHGRTEFRVENMTSDPCVDVDIGMDVQSMPYWSSNNNKARPNFRYRCGLKKTGPGTLRLGGKFTCPKSTKIEEGALVFDGTLAEQNSGWGLSAMEVKSGAYLGGTGTVHDVTIEEGGGFTSVLGQTGALEIGGAVTLPSSGDVRINIVCTNDMQSLVSYKVPVVQASGLTGAKFVPVFNGGAALPPNFGMTAVVHDGIVYGAIARKGMMIIVR